MTDAPETTTSAPAEAVAAPAPAADTAAPAAQPESTGRPPRSRGGRGGRGRRARPADGAAATDPEQQQAAQPAAKQPNAPRKPQQQAARKVHPVLERLFELYPKLFGARFLPLKLGIYQELLAAHGDEFKAEDLKLAVGLHARSTRYLECVAAGHPRHDLQGHPVEPVAPEHIHHAILEAFRRRQARTKEDLGPQLRERIMAAIEASGVGREVYAERVRARDDASNAALDDALAELGRQAAKREALVRAFEASGKTEAEFADMYGMDPKEVARTLNRVRRDKAEDEKRAAAAAAAEAAPAADDTAPAAETPAA
ncbi:MULTISPECIES: ProQ/FINO family protein [unclassified Variovorax]|uniref:ProQ/FINO family protein n=1 Tax=unclassified Variovorax TaxID=663243 RepID=UPI0025773745|nr:MULTISPECIES: ProQ/FINO family protein [unclassified Variovorax]MDM0090097.1 ProQ/FINO family protein [Variovorax sp. J22G40]MDM0148237.1 ProQ/FINO family protein [Variovorax sp. J2P1-31]